MLNRKNVDYGFTLVEVIIIVMILAIISLVSVPMLSNAESVQIKSAANMIASDLEYARSLSITTGRTHSVVFNTSNASYRILDNSGSVIAHPVRIGSNNYIVDFAGDSRLYRVNIVSAVFGATSTVKFNSLGAPFDGDGNAINSGIISLTAGNNSLTVNVEPATGYISISN